jgi:hypothetical protein
MILNRIAVPVFALVLGVTGVVISAPRPASAQPGWDVPPREFNQVQQRGFHDGVEGARKDFGNGRRPDVDNRDEYRNPDLPPGLRRTYREAFRRGYQVAASHLWGAAPGPPPVRVQPPPPPPPPPQSDSDSWGMRGLTSEAQRRGYHDGRAEAQKDFTYHLPTDPDTHQEYQNPPVPPQVADDYREGFMRGYTVEMSRTTGDPAWQLNGNPSQWAPPSRFSQIARRGFREGIDGANKDFGNHRRPNPANRDEYRRPPVPPQFWPDYRKGFRRGYEMAAARLWGGA